ncbi:IS701 family transposase, partial [Rhodococcus jostii]
GGIGIDDQGMIGYTVPEIRRLLVYLIPPDTPAPTSTPGPGHTGADADSTRPAPCHYRTRGHVP